MNDFNALPEFEEKVRQAVRVPAATPEFVNHLRSELARRPVKTKPRWTLRPAWAIAFAIAIIVLIVSTPKIVAAVKQLFGYVPGIGLVDTSSGLRILAEPASVTRDGVTLTVKQAIVYPDHVQVVFETDGIAPEDDIYQGADEQDNPTAFCGGVNVGEAPNKDDDPMLRLPDGTIIERVFGSDEYPDNVFYAKPAFKAAIPEDVTEMTLVLKCIYGSRLGAVPENWEVPLKLTTVPEGTTVGEPVIEVVPSDLPAESPVVSNQGIDITLEKVVPQANIYNFFFRIEAQQPEENLLALFPASAYLIDSTGQKIAMIYNHPWQPGEQVDLWELQTTAQPAYGPYTLVIDQIFAYYKLDQPTFVFDLGQNPQVGQSWPLDQTINFGSHTVQVASAQMMEKDLTEYGLSKNVQGIEFTFEAANGKDLIRLGILDDSAAHNNAGQVIPNSDNEVSTAFHAGLYYEKGIPSDKIPVTLYEAAVVTPGHWELHWASPEQTGVTQLSDTQAIVSQPGASGVKASLKRVVKLDDGHLFFIHLTPSDQRPNFDYIEPGAVYVIDSSGQKIELTLDAPQWYLAGPDTLWQYHAAGEIAEGPMQLVVEKAKAHYTTMPLDTPPTEQVIEAHTFTFQAGPTPQTGQTWTLDQAFEIGGYKGIVKYVQAVAFDPAQHLEIQDAQGYEKGYEFTVQLDDPALRTNLWLEVKPSNPAMWTPTLKIDGEPGPSFTQTILFQGDMLNQQVKVTFYGLSVLLEETWTLDWTMPKQ